MTAPSAAANPCLVGHDEAMRLIEEAFSSGRMPHAWLMTGADGIGKTTLAYHIANHVLSSGKNPLGRLDLQHRITKLVMSDAHPDMMVLRRSVDERTGEPRNVIVVDDALKVASFLHRTATHGGWRVVIIDEAHRLNRFAQNAILKIVEEPPARALILMTATTPGALLPTIRSRSRVLHLAPLDAAPMRDALGRAEPNLAEEDRERVVALARGSIGFALKIVSSEALPLYDELTEIMREFPGLDTARLHKFADQIARKADSERFEVIIELLTEYLRGRIRAEARSAGHSGLAHRLDMWDRFRATFAMAEGANLDRKLAFIKAISDIRVAMA